MLGFYFEYFGCLFYVHIQRIPLHCAVPCVSDYGVICSAFTFFPTLSFKCGLSGVGFGSAVPLSAKAGAAFAWWDAQVVGCGTELLCRLE